MGSMFCPFAFLFDDDLGQDGAGDVLARLGVLDREVLPLAHHLREIVQRHIGGGRRIVEPAVGIFLNPHCRLVAVLVLTVIMRGHPPCMQRSIAGCPPIWQCNSCIAKSGTGSYYCRKSRNSWPPTRKIRTQAPAQTVRGVRPRRSGAAPGTGPQAAGPLAGSPFGGGPGPDPVSPGAEADDGGALSLDAGFPTSGRPRLCPTPNSVPARVLRRPLRAASRTHIFQAHIFQAHIFQAHIFQDWARGRCRST